MRTLVTFHSSAFNTTESKAYFTESDGTRKMIFRPGGRTPAAPSPERRTSGGAARGGREWPGNVRVFTISAEVTAPEVG